MTGPAVLLLLAFAGGCGDDGAGAPDGGGDAALDGGPGGPIYVGGDRPARVAVPGAYDGTASLPLVVLLHGYGIGATIQNAYFGLGREAQARGFFLLLPEGTPDDGGRLFWNALPEWPDAPMVLADDVAYLRSLVDEMETRFGIDRSRVYFIGHSNGAFMAHRMACDADGLAAAIVSLAGSSYANAADCAATAPISAILIHGDADDTIPYGGTPIFPGAVDLAARWATHDGCAGPATAGEPVDFDSTLAGEETEVAVHASGCAAGTDVELWTIRGGGHLPSIEHAAVERFLDWLLRHRRP